nr:hypothetical protein BaRGS_021065 [Batillaria attramentaria]
MGEITEGSKAGAIFIMHDDGDEDDGGNVLANQPFHLNWAWISLESDVIIANETQEMLEVVLRRRGYLGETSFVSIAALNDTARVGEDVNARYAAQVQFNPGQTEKTWRIRLINDDVYEAAEELRLKLSEPVMAVLEYPEEAKVIILDPEDESLVYFPDAEYRVAEDIGEVLIPVHRTGDLSGETMVICSTIQGTAAGTVPSTVTSFSDYITRAADHRSVIRFDKGEKEKYCRVMIIDDSLYEGEESFKVILTDSMGGRIGDVSESTVIIEPDKVDGTDLSKPSNVTVRSRKSKPKSAESGLDYIAVNKILSFAHGVTMQRVRVPSWMTLVDPAVEGPETFQLLLRMPADAYWASPSVAVITINDSISDGMQFKDDEYKIFENDGVVRAYVTRLTMKRCGEVRIINDTKYEGEEMFRLVLGSPDSQSLGRAVVGKRNATQIIIKDDGDKLVFGANVSKIDVDIEILFDEIKEMREVFTVHLRHRRWHS